MEGESDKASAHAYKMACHDDGNGIHGMRLPLLTGMYDICGHANEIRIAKTGN